jgi:hypothetical protein
MGSIHNHKNVKTIFKTSRHPGQHYVTVATAAEIPCHKTYKLSRQFVRHVRCHSHNSARRSYDFLMIMEWDHISISTNLESGNAVELQLTGSGNNGTAICVSAASRMQTEIQCWQKCMANFYLVRVKKQFLKSWSFVSDIQTH